MWLVNVLVVASGITFSLLQTPVSEQTSSREKPGQQTEGQASQAPLKPNLPVDSASAVGDTEPVITIRGLCAEGTGSSGQTRNPCNK